MFNDALSSFSSSDRITIRQKFDPYVDDVQYIAWREVTLESNGDLCMSKIGLGMPGDCFFIVFHEEGLPIAGLFTPYDRVSATDIPRLASYEDSPSPILTVIEGRDSYSALVRNHMRVKARIREEQIAYWKGLVTPAWNWVALFSKALQSSKSNSIPTPPKVQQPENVSSVSTCVPYKSNTFGLVHRRQTAKVG